MYIDIKSRVYAKVMIQEPNSTNSKHATITVLRGHKQTYRKESALDIPNDTVSECTNDVAKHVQEYADVNKHLMFGASIKIDIIPK